MEKEKTSFENWILDNKIEKTMNRFIYKDLVLSQTQLYRKYEIWLKGKP